VEPDDGWLIGRLVHTGCLYTDLGRPGNAAR
jgi:hypothetical protein